MSRAHHWCFTLYGDYDVSKDEDPVSLYDSSQMEYIVYQLERCPKTQKLHIQGFVSYLKQLRMKKAKDLIHSTAHMEVARGSHKQAADYCKKSDTNVKGPWEYGTPPVGKGARTDLKTAVAAIKEGKTMQVVASENPCTFVHYSKGLIALRAQLFPSPAWRDLNVTWLWGTTGIGKTRSAYTYDPGLYKAIMPCQWWDGYDCQSTVLFDDFYGQVPVSMMLRLLDWYPEPVQTKNGRITPSYETIIITSNVAPKQWYRKLWDRRPETEPAFMRRLDEVHEVRKTTEVGNRVHEVFAYNPLAKRFYPEPQDTLETTHSNDVINDVT